MRAPPRSSSDSSEVRSKTQDGGHPHNPGGDDMTLDRLEKKGLLVSCLTEPVAERGGRAKRCYKVTKPAVAALTHSRRALINLWEGLELAD